MITAEKLNFYIKNPEKLDQKSLADLRDLLEKFPYFQSVRMVYLKNLYVLHDEEFLHELKRSVLFVADRRCLFYFIQEARFDFVSRPVKTGAKMEKEPSVDSTLSIIDDFLGDKPGPEKKKQLRYVFDYAASLEEDNKEVENETKDSLPDFLPDDSFTLANKKSSSVSKHEIEQRVIDSNAPLDDASFTETLAEIYLKQGRYERAIEIIEKLSLKFPKKNAYFADRIVSIKQAKQKNSI